MSVLVEVQEYGSEGFMPCEDSVISCCKYNNSVSCVSGSGSSICGGYLGQTPLKSSRGFDLIECQEDGVTGIYGYELKNFYHQEEDIQQLSYRVFELIEPAIKQAIAQAIEEHLKQ
jgi:hypothetical protein